jgi:predicted unusual protein kinase regulating ubiquinone biosynthesis (AarF/ABC1/UbiB family)
MKVFGRLFEVALISSWHAAAFLVLAPWLGREERRWLAGKRLSLLCQRLGGGILKAAQLLSVRTDVIPYGVAIQLKSLQDQVRAETPASIRGELQRAYGSDFADLFADIGIDPIAAGSVAQVHVATLTASCEIVALKIRRPHIHRTLVADASVIETLGRGLEVVIPRVPFRALAAEVAMALRQQTDFDTEARTQECLRSRLQGEQLVVPRLRRELCRENVLVMDFVKGLRRIDDEDIEIVAHRRVIKIALNALYQMLFHEGRFHCDLHSGNLLVDELGRVAILDFGFCGSLSEGQRADFRDFFLSIALNRGSYAAAILLRTATYVPPALDKNCFEADVVQLIRAASKKSAEQFGVTQFATSLFLLQKKYGVVSSSQFSLAIGALLVFEGTALQRYPELDFQSEAVTLIAGPGVSC